MEYTRILKRAVEITWRHKALWLYGFLLVLFTGGGGGQGFQYRVGRTDWRWGAGLLLLAIVIAVVFAVVALVLANLSRGALIHMARQVEEAGHTSVNSGWCAGRSLLGSLIPLDLITSIPAVIVAMSLFALAASPLLLLLARRQILRVLAVFLTVVFGVVALGVVVVGGVALGLVREFAYRQAVLEGKGILQSIRDAYSVIRARARQVWGMWLLLLGIDLLVSLVLFPVILAFLGMAAAWGWGVYALTESVATAVIIGSLVGVPVLLLIALVSGVYLAFRSTCWTLAYRELQSVV